MKLIHTFIFFLFSLALTDCGDNNNVNPNNYDVLIPLKVGNYWINTHTLFNADGSKINTHTDTTYIVEKYTMNSEDVYHLKTAINKYGNVITKDEFIFNKTDGLYGMGILGDDAYFPELIFKFPIQAGEEFYSGEEKVTLLSSNRLTKVPAGDFNCLVYEKKFIYLNKFYKVIYHFAINIGIIYYESWESADDKESNAYLSKYSVLEGYKLN
jgi:hypothetical protein